MRDVLAQSFDFSQIVQRTTEAFGGYLPNALAALGVLIGGWIVALFLTMLTRACLRSTGISGRLAGWTTGEGEAGEQAAGEQRRAQIEKQVGRGVFALAMVFVVVAFFQVLGLTVITEPLNAFLSQVFAYVPQLIGAVLLGVVAWIAASVIRFAVDKALTAARVDQRLSRQVEQPETMPISHAVAEASYWLTLLLFLPAVLGALGMPGLLEPVQVMVGKVLAFLPNLFGAAAILIAGWFLARILQRIVTHLLAAIGTDRVSERVGVSTLLGQTTLSSLCGLVVYVLTLIPVLVASLNALKLEAVTRPASTMLDTMLGALPGIFAAVLVIGLAYVVGRLVAGLVTNLLTSVGFNKLPRHLGLSERLIEQQEGEGRRTLSDIAGNLVLVAVVLFAVLQALPLLGFETLASLMSDFLVFAGRVVTGLAIIGLGMWLAKLAADAIRDSRIAQADLLAITTRAAILILAGAMGLQQMGVADQVITVAFGLLGGAIAVSAAIAFGIGGRDAAKSMIDSVYRDRLSAVFEGNGRHGRREEPTVTLKDKPSERIREMQPR